MAPTIVKDMPSPEEERMDPSSNKENTIFPKEKEIAKDEEYARQLQAEFDAAAAAILSTKDVNLGSSLNETVVPVAHVLGGEGGPRPSASGGLTGAKVATLSNPWEFDDVQNNCSHCKDAFNVVNRKHHCRLCGKIFCNKCSTKRSLVPPSSIVLTPIGGKKATSASQRANNENSNSTRRGSTSNAISFTPDPDPDRMLTYIDEDKQLLYGKGLEERFTLSREPLRVCDNCYVELQPLQEELRTANSNCMRFNHIDATDPMKRFLNSPLAFTLGHEVRKAAYTLNNLLPLPKRMGTVVDMPSSNNPSTFLTGDDRDIQQCKDECSSLSPSLSNLDGVSIPAKLLEDAKGVAIMTIAKGGFGVAGVEFGTGLVVARLGDNQQWSAPCAIGMFGMSWGALVGAQVSDHVFLLMTDAAVELMFAKNGNVQLGADIGVAVGPLGRALEADFGAAPGAVAPIYTYSLSKGLYAGISLDGKVIVKRDRVNEKFYGREVTGAQILTGEIPSPPAARPLYDALQRCHVYARNNEKSLSPPFHSSSWSRYPSMQGHSEFSQSHFDEQVGQQQQQHPQPSFGYGDPLMPPATNDQHSYAGLSDITSDRSF